MSWIPKWSNLSGRLSPFARSPRAGPATVSDADFSYITADDLRRHQQEGGSLTEAVAEEYGPERDTDMVTVRNKRTDYHVHFAAYTIAKGELKVGDLREAVAKKTNTPDSRAIKLLYKGRNLKDDTRTCKAEGLKDGSELLCTIADLPSASTSQSDDEDDEFNLDEPSPAADGTTKKRRNRGKKTLRRNKREAAAAAAAEASAQSNLGVPLSQNSTRSSSPKPVPSPATPLDKLNALQATLNQYLSESQRFMSDPPSDPAKREFDYKRLSETVLTQVLIKLDGVETEGDDDARARRKALVKDAQKLLSDLDAVMKK